MQVTLVPGSEENSIHNAAISKLWKEEMVTQFVGAHSWCNVQYSISQFKQQPSPPPLKESTVLTSAYSIDENNNQYYMYWITIK